MNGMITGPYIEGFYQPFFYNKTLTDKIGLKIKDRGMTFDDLLSYFKAVSDYNKKNGTDISILYDAGDAKGGIGYGPSTWNIFQSLFRSEFPDLDEDKRYVPILKKQGFKILGHEMHFYGICRKCQGRRMKATAVIIAFLLVAALTRNGYGATGVEKSQYNLNAFINKSGIQFIDYSSEEIEVFEITK